MKLDASSHGNGKTGRARYFKRMYKLQHVYFSLPKAQQNFAEAYPICSSVRYGQHSDIKRLIPILMVMAFRTPNFLSAVIRNKQ